MPRAGNLLAFDGADRIGKEPMAKQTKITMERDSLLVLRSSPPRRGWCPLCAADGEMIAVNETAVISNLEGPALEEWLNSSDLHRSQAPDGSLLICVDSLLARVLKGNSI